MFNLQSVIKEEKPFEWYLIENPIDSSLRTELINFFPKYEYLDCIKYIGSKPYYMKLHKIYKNSEYNYIPNIKEKVWREIFQYLISNTYYEQVYAVTKNELILNSKIEINLWLYPNTGYLSPHIDKDKKILSQLFYFNSYWLPHWGGALRLLNSSNVEDIAYEFFPNTTSSIILTQSNKSWHAVTKQQSPLSEERCVLQIIFWQEGVNVTK